MNGGRFDQHMAMLQRWAVELPLQESELLAAAFEEIHTILEELQVAEEQLWQQNQHLYQQTEQLRQQNEELVTTRQALEVERQRYQDLFEFAPDGYLLTNAVGIIQEGNSAAATLLNLSKPFLVGKPLVIFLSEEDREAFNSQLSKLPQNDWVREWQMRLQPFNSKPFDAALTVAAVRNREGKLVAMRCLMRDITEHKRAESQIRYSAFHDALTGLPNRALFMDRLKHAVQQAKRQKNYLFAVLFLDLDRFKVINDSLGHILGDQFLTTIASRLEGCLRLTDTAARFGGDEFTILLEGLKDVSDAIRVADRIQKELALPFDLGGQEVFTSASIGIAMSATGYEQPEDLLRAADTAMYRAKVLGKARYELFNTGMHAEAVARLQLETDLRRAVERQEFQIHYQPIVALDTGFITGFEALVRWQHPLRGLVYPKDFIPVGVETGLSIPIDRWVIAQACYQTKQWQEQFPNRPPLTISVNLCSRQFAQPDLIKHIDQVLWETNLDPHNLKLEITESVIMENSESATVTISQLRNLGIQLSIDDFGTGYSSLSRLHHFPISVLKIDRSFVSRMGLNEGNLEIVETIVTLAQKLGVCVTAEGVETAEQLAQLRKLKCEYGQGYFFSRPLDTLTAETLIMRTPQW